MIRKSEREDIEGILALWLETNISAHNFIEENYWRENYDAVKEMMKDSEIYVFDDKGKILGFVGLMTDYIGGIFVNHEYQGREIGKKLLNHVKMKYDRLLLNVYEKNERAYLFYIREGFIVRNFQIDENTKEKEYIMEWQK